MVVAFLLLQLQQLAPKEGFVLLPLQISEIDNTSRWLAGSLAPCLFES
jgi:hypothetical protein